MTDGRHHDVGAAEELRGSTTTATTPVSIAPNPFIAARRRQPRVRSLTPMDHHARLGQREAHEHSDGVERDHAVGLGPEDHDHDDGRDRQADDAVGEDQPVAPVHELAGHEAVAREHGGQAGKPA